MTGEEQSNDGLNHIEIIEDIVALMGIGRMGYYIYQGALDEEDCTPEEAVTVLTAYYAGMFYSSKYHLEDEDDEETSSS